MAGRKIDDHSSWIGGGASFPMGVKLKSESSAEGAGRVLEYCDTTESIKKDQSAGVSKMNSHKMKSGHRN